VGYRFLCREWFDEVARIRESMGPIELPDPIRDLKINLEVREGPDGETVQCHFGVGALSRGLTDAPTTVRLPYDVARQIFVDRDSGAAMRAFMTGQIQIEGDVTRLMTIQSASQGSNPAAVELIVRIAQITE